MKNTLEYTTILHRFRINNGLSLLEYCFCDMVYFLSTNKNNAYDGWCWMEKQKQSENLGISRQSLFDIEKKMILNGFIEKDDRTFWTRTTKKWDEVYLKKDCDLRDVKKLDTIKKQKQCKESLHDDVKKLDTACKETLHPTYNIYNYNYNDNDNEENLNEQENNLSFPDAFSKEEKSCEKKEEKTKDKVNNSNEIISPKKENKRAKKESFETFDEVLKTAYFAGYENRCFGKMKDGTAVEFFANHDINGKIKGYQFFLTKEQKNDFISTLGKEIFEDCCEEFADWLGRDTPTALAVKAKKDCSHKDLFTKKNSWLIAKVVEKRAKKDFLKSKQKNSESLEERILKENIQLIKQLHGKR